MLTACGLVACPISYFEQAKTPVSARFSTPLRNVIAFLFKLVKAAVLLFSACVVELHRLFQWESSRAHH